MRKAVEIGKYTLESLTTGMYEQPLIVYREYIQNAVDSLEEALRRNLLVPLGMRIDIEVNADDSYICITDNGVGIAEAEAERVLLSVGSSQKSITTSRGFRGIGRLGGLSYCDKLIFETTCAGESRTTFVEFDCKSLKQLLLPGQSDGMSMEEVLSSVSTVSLGDAEEDEHYFVVRMEGVDVATELLSVNKVMDYLSQGAPVAYNANFFVSNKIKNYLLDKGIALSEFPIFIDTGNGRPKPIYKACRRHYQSGRENEDTTIYDVEMFDVLSDVGELLAVGWYAQSNWAGTIRDDSIRGLRLRKGNIQIGDERTLNGIFKQPRFNGWTQGEVFALSNDLIPNARRDHFEQNAAFHQLMNALSNGIGAQLSSMIVKASSTRNDPVKKALDEGRRMVEMAEKATREGFTSEVSKENLLRDVVQTIVTLQCMPPKQRATSVNWQEAVEALASAKTLVEESNNYKTNALKGIISRKDNKLLTIVSNALTKYLDDRLASQIIEDIIASLKSVGGKVG